MDRMLGLSNSAPRPSLPNCGRSKTSRPKLATFSLLFSIGSGKDSIPSTSTRPRLSSRCYQSPAPFRTAQGPRASLRANGNARVSLALFKRFPMSTGRGLFRGRNIARETVRQHPVALATCCAKATVEGKSAHAFYLRLFLFAYTRTKYRMTTVDRIGFDLDRAVDGRGVCQTGLR